MIALLLGLAACTGDCKGPECEDAWPASRLVVTDLPGLQANDNVLEQPARLDGLLAHGAEWSVAATGGRIVVGMPERSAVSLVDPPKVFTALAEEPTIQGASAERFGASVAVADTDGDGREELWVGAPGHDGDRGAVYRFPDASSPIDPDLVLVGGTPADGLGALVTACGDVTGDGRADLVVAAPWFAAPAGWDEPAVSHLAGAVWLLRSEVLLGAEDGYPWEVGTTWVGSERGAGVGRAVVCDRDLTGDGLADVAIGAPFAGDADAGRVYIRTGSDGPGPLLDEDPLTLIPDERAWRWFGAALATRIDADGVELVVGAPGWGDPTVVAPAPRGRVLLVRAPLGDERPFTPDAAFTGPRDDAPDHFGNAVATGDLDGDGWSDLLVGAPQWNGARGARTLYSTGRAWIWSSATRFRWSVQDDPSREDPELASVRGTQPFLRIGAGARLIDLDGEGFAKVLLPVRAPDPDER